MWQSAEVKAVVGTPYKPSGENVGDESRLPEVPRAVEIRPEEPDAGPKTRAMKIMPEHLGKAGFTTGCPKCNALQRGGGESVSLAHSPACRKRVEDVVRKDEKMKDAVERAEQRRNEYLSRSVEAKDKEDAKRRKKEQVAPGEEETPGAGTSSSSSSGQAIVTPERPNAHVEEDVELEEVTTAEVEEGNKRKREETGGEAIEGEPAAVYRQLPPVDDKRKREAEDEGERKSQRKTERGEYERDMQMLADSRESCDFVMLTEKQVRCRGESECDFAEVFSPPRTTARARQRGLRGGWSLDVNHEDPWTGRKWDLRDEKCKEAARSLLRRTRPKLLIASPPCTLFSLLQNLSGGVKDNVRMQEAIDMVDFAVELCIMQHRAGRKFVFEHPDIRPLPRAGSCRVSRS